MGIRVKRSWANEIRAKRLRGERDLGRNDPDFLGDSSKTIMSQRVVTLTERNY